MQCEPYNLYRAVVLYFESWGLPTIAKHQHLDFHWHGLNQIHPVTSSNTLWMASNFTLPLCRILKQRNSVIL